MNVRMTLVRDRRAKLAALLLFGLILLDLPSLATGVSSNVVFGQYDPNYPAPIAPPRGSLVLHGGGPLSPELRKRFVELAGGERAKIVVIPTAAADDAGQVDLTGLADAWNDFKPASVEVVHAATRDEALRPEFSEPLTTATGVWMPGGKQSRLAGVYLDTPVEQALAALVARGGVVGGSSAGAAIMTRVMIVRGEERRGFDLLPGAVVDQHFRQRQREDRLRTTLDAHPDLIGLGVDAGTALVVRGRRLEVVGDGAVTVMIARSATRGERLELLAPGKTADLLALSRAAVARRQPAFPPPLPAPPELAGGSLVIVGGGRTPKGLLEKFVELAGGPEASIVYVPCEEQERIVEPRPFLEALKKLGAKNVAWIHTKDRRRADQDEALLAPLRTAGGVWFGGGRQWNLVDSYQNTTAHRLMLEVVKRGGVVGGSSAGASIQGDYMPRGDPLGNLEIMAEGYERGLGFLTGVAIDQHFRQRNRFGDMLRLTTAYPQLLGLGIDESTALIVQGRVATVVGDGQVAVYDARQPKHADGKAYETLRSGDRWDMVARQLAPPP